MPAALLSPCPSYQTNESGGRAPSSLDLNPPALPDKRHEPEPSVAATATSPIGDLVQNGRVSAGDARRMTQLWISMLTDKNGNLCTSISDSGSSSSLGLSALPSTSAIPATRSPNLLSVPSRAVSTAASSDCCDPQLHGTARRSSRVTSLEVPQSTGKRNSDASFVTCASAASETMGVPQRAVRSERASLNPFEIHFMKTSGGFVAPRATTSEVSPSITSALPSTSAPPAAVIPLTLPGPRRSQSVPQRSVKPVVAASASVPKLERQAIRKSGWPVSAGASYHNRFQRQRPSLSSTISSTSSADTPALLHSPLDMAFDSDLTPRLRESSFVSLASRTSVAHSDHKSSVVSADSMNSFPSSVRSSSSCAHVLTAAPTSVRDSTRPTSQLSGSTSPGDDALLSLEEAAERDDTIRLELQPRPISKLVTASEKRASQRHSTLDIVMYGVAM